MFPGAKHPKEHDWPRLVAGIAGPCRCTALLARPAYLKRHRFSTTPSYRTVTHGTWPLWAPVCTLRSALCTLHPALCTSSGPIIHLLLFAIPLPVSLFRPVKPRGRNKSRITRLPLLPIPDSGQCLITAHFDPVIRRPSRHTDKLTRRRDRNTLHASFHFTHDGLTPPANDWPLLYPAQTSYGPNAVNSVTPSLQACPARARG